MVLTFNEWIAKRDNKIGSGPKSVHIDLANGTKVTINGHEQIGQLSHVENTDLRTCTLDTAINASLACWSKKDAFRREVIEKLHQYFVDHSKKQASSGDTQTPNCLKVKNCLRTSALKNILDRSNGNKSASVSSESGPFTQRIVVTATHGSLIAITNQLLTHLLNGLPISLITNPDSAPSAEYLLYLLKEFGLCDGVVEHLVQLNASQQGQTLTFVLFGDADVDAALDSALDAYIQFGWSSIKIFAQESLKNQIQNVLDQKLKSEFSRQDLIIEDGLY